ncbi:MAG: zinc metallopeptidase [Kiritimatiellae bacterium]|nr:zinc metallopeptidase [Kiritimatiellia bacterium]
MYFDYMLFMLPAMLLAGLATLFTKTTFNRYSRVASRRGMSGAQAAQALMNSQGIHDVTIEPVRGFLSDHYDPRSRTLRLSPDVYQSRSLSAIGVACHEAGHALQHASRYAPLMLRSSLVPMTQVGTNLSYFLFMGGLFLRIAPLMKIGALLFGLAVLFSLVTLPVEWDASARAKRLMVSCGIVSEQESSSAGRVLNAAFMTYVAAAVTSLMTLLYYLLRSGLLGGSDD